MKAKQIWANLPVKDVEQTKAFYKALGFEINGESSSGGKTITIAKGVIYAIY